MNKEKEVTIEEVEEMIAAVDEGGDGEIQLPEFLQLMADQMGQQEEDEELIAAFKRFGVNSVDDVITLETLKATLVELEEDLFDDEEL